MSSLSASMFTDCSVAGINLRKSVVISCCKAAPGWDIKTRHSKINCSLEIVQTYYGIAVEFDCKSEIMQIYATLRTSLNSFSCPYREREESAAHLELRETEYVAV